MIRDPARSLPGVIALSAFSLLTVAFSGASAQTEPAAVSFQQDSDRILESIDFDAVRVGESIDPIEFSIFNNADVVAGAAAEFVSASPVGDESQLDLVGLPVDPVAPGESISLSIAVDTSTAGSYGVSYFLTFASLGLPEAEAETLSVAAFVDVYDRGDYDYDGDVDEDDYQVWAEEFGSTGGAADGDGDGVVTAADYTVWRESVEAMSAAPIPEAEAAILALACVGSVGAWCRELLTGR